MSQNVCRRNKFGYCKYVDKCRYTHNNEICLSANCSVYNCDKRHPKVCNFQRVYGRCKFAEDCRYSHQKPKDILENSNKIEILEKKIEDLENKIENLLKMGNKHLSCEKKVENLEEKIKATEKEFKKKLNGFRK